MSTVQRPLLLHPLVKPLVFLAGLGPLAWLVLAALQDQLGANPAEALIRSLGDWTLRLLWITLAITPLREALRQPALARLRSMLGLFTAFYASLHLLAYGWLDMGLVPQDIARDIAKRPFILVGFLAFAGLLPLAATSFNRAIRALGAARWQRLHRLVYGIAVLALLHFVWMRAGKHNFLEPALYGAVLALLLGWRVRSSLARRRHRASALAAGRA